MTQPERGRRCVVDAAESVGRLRTDADIRCVIAQLTGSYRGEQAFSVGLGGLDVVLPAAAFAVVAASIELLAEDARLELRSLRRPLRRALLDWSAASDTASVLVAARRKLVLQRPADPAIERWESLGSNRRRILRLVERDGGHCVWCSTPLTHLSVHATVDHVRCRSHGGTDTIDNLVLACAPCNNRRSDSQADAWLEACLRNGHRVDVDAVRAALARLPQAA